MSMPEDELELSSDVVSTDLTAEGVLEQPETDRTGFEGYENYVEVQRYWVLRPYAYVSILYHEQHQDYIYYVVEPELEEFENLLYVEIADRLRDRLMTKELDENVSSVASKLVRREDTLLEEALQVARDYGVGVEDKSLHKILYYIERDFIRYGKIEPIMQDPRIEDISCDGVEVPIYVFHRQRQDVKTNVKFERKEVNNFVIRLAQRSGKHISAAEPLVDASLPDGSRAQLTLGGDISDRGSTFTIRKFRDEPLTPINLIEFGTFSVEQMSYLWLAIENGMSLVFAGGTGSGKTTSMNAVSLFIPPKQKIVTIEDTREITLPHDNWIPMVTRGSFGATDTGEEGSNSGEVDMFKLLTSALRQRPEYLLVGEVRGPEARTLFQAMSTGHTTYSTFHAEDVDSVFQRFRNPPIEVPEQMLRALDIVSVQEEIRIGGKQERRNRVVSEIQGLSEDSEGVNYENYFTYDPETDTHIEAPGISTVMNKIAEENPWTLEETEEERERRQEVLEYMLERGITDYKEVTRIIQAYIIDRERILEQVRDGTLSPEQFEEMQSIV